MTYIIGVSGLARSGKNTCAEMLKDVLNTGDLYTKRVSFADALKSFYRVWQEEAGRMPVEETAKYMAHKLASPIVGGDPFGTEFFDTDRVVSRIREWVEASMENPEWWTTERKNTPYSEANKAIHRRCLIDLGMFMRSIDDNYWVKATMNYHGRPDAMIVSDVRFQNEAEACDHVVRVIRPGCSLIYHNGEIDQSELFALVGEYDTLVDNSLNPGYLYDQVLDLADTLVSEIKGNRIAASVV